MVITHQAHTTIDMTGETENLLVKSNLNTEKSTNYHRLITGGIALVLVDILWVGSAELSDVGDVVWNKYFVSTVVSFDLLYVQYRWTIHSYFFIIWFHVVYIPQRGFW